MRTKLPRIYHDEPILAGANIPLDDWAARHASSVLRLNVGDSLVLFHDGMEADATITATGRRGTTVVVAAVRPVDRESMLDITLAQGISRQERMDLTIQKAVELGATGIAPLTTERSTVRLSPERAASRVQHWRRVIISACEQSGRTRLPTLMPIMTLEEWLGRTITGSLLHLRSTAPTSIRALEVTNKVTLLIGPEGGLSSDEHEQAAAAGYCAVHLGRRILRTETAALAAIAALQALYGDWQ